MKRFPVTLIAALLAVSLTATAVFAARSPHVFGPNVAPAATIIPDEPAPTATATKVAPAATETDKPEAAEPSETDEDAAGAKPDASAHPSNHGQVVSAAAQASTPAGCKNHGEYVSLVARGDVDPSASPSPSQSVCDVASPKGGDEEAGNPGKSGNGNGANGAQNGNSNNGKGKGPAPRPTRN